MADVSMTIRDYSALGTLLRPAGAVNGPAELQGALCGQLCGPALADNDWLAFATEFMGLTEGPDAALAEALLTLLHTTRTELSSQSVQFQLLLPADSEDLTQRAEALSAWCHGFLSGFGAAVTANLPSEINDTLGDFAAIVQIEADEDDAASAETDFLQIADYVRGASMGLHQALSPESETLSTPPVVH